MNARTVCAALAAAICTAVNAASITIGSVTQRWPWNNKVDITYTVTDGQNRAAGIYYGIDFDVTANGRIYHIFGCDLGASAEGGAAGRQHTVTWIAPVGIRATDCSMTATLYPTNVPSGNDYMIVDLTSGKVMYEGLFATQDESNARYNIAEYKTSKLILRKIPKWVDRNDLPNASILTGAGYHTGDDVNYPTSISRPNTSKTWATDRDYYLGVFPVTQSQYQKIYGSNPSEKKTTISGNEVTHRPVEKVSYGDLRSSAASTSQIPAVNSNTGTFFQRLNFKTGLYFDLPTEVMFEIAERAGSTTTYYWGDTMVTNYVVCSENSGNSTVAVGSRLPNDWGFYDACGNLWEWCLDVAVEGNLTARTDAFTPAWAASGNTRRWWFHGGGGWNQASTHTDFKASARGTANANSLRSNGLGFRVSFVAK